MEKTDTPRTRKAKPATSKVSAPARPTHLRAVEPGDQSTIGAGFERNIDDQSIDWILEEAKKGLPAAQTRLGDYYAQRDKKDITRNGKEAIEWYLKAAKQGYRPAEFALGQLYLNGYYNEYYHHCDMDIKEGTHWTRIAATRGHPEAQRCMAEICKHHTGEIDEAVDWYKLAIENGNGEAAHNLGNVYFDGFKRIPRDRTEALRWHRRAVELGFMRACLDIGRMYELGEDVPQDYDVAVEWYRKLADAENVAGVDFSDRSSALTYIAGVFEKRNDGRQDHAEAIRWYRQAAELSNGIFGLMDLGHLYENGSDVQDYAEAAHFYRLAGTKGDHEGWSALSELERKIAAGTQVSDNTVAEKQEQADNRPAPPIFKEPPPQEQFLDKEKLLKLTNELLAAKFGEQSTSSLARVLAQIIDGADDVAALEARLAPLLDTPSTAALAAAVEATRLAPPPPETAPELYRDRPRDRKTGRREFVEQFFTRVYAPWIVEGVLTIPRKKLRGLDPEAEFALAGWLTNHRHKQLPFKVMASLDEGDGPPYTAEQVRRARTVARWADRHRDEIKEL